jgi:alkylation response protein AidB-like acyl-CoA dehydrogenase
VDFTFSPEQEAFRQAVRDTLARRAPISYVREMVEDERGFTDEVWDELRGLDWCGLLVPEAYGGLGLDLVDAVVIQEEMGRALFPGPYFSSAIVAVLAATRLGATELLPGLASGETRGTVALEEAGHGDPVARVRTRASRGDGSGGWVLDGLKPVVPDGHTADWAIVVARTDEGLGSFLVDQPGGERVPVWDETRKMARLDLVGRPATRIGPDGDHTELWRRVVDDVAVLVAADTVGSCERAFELAVEYSKQRVQFGRPIATFQAIKHKAADMLHQLELARVGTHYAAWASAVDDPERETAAAMCKGFVGEAAVFVTSEDIQIHGGVGFTWDVDCHLHYRRAKQNDLLFGWQGWQRRRLADMVLGPA